MNHKDRHGGLSFQPSVPDAFGIGLADVLHSSWYHLSKNTVPYDCRTVTYSRIGIRA